MTPALRVGLMGLALVELAAAAFVVLQIDRRTKRLNSRVERLGAAPAQAVVTPQRAVVRRSESATGKRNLLRVLLNMPSHSLPGASVPLWISATGALFAAGFCGMVASVFISPVVAPFAAAGGAIMIVRVLHGRQQRSYARKLLLQMPDMIELVVSAVRAGMPLAEALRSVAREMPSPTRDEFAQVNNAITLGVAPDVAIRALHERSGLTEYAIFSVTLAVQSRSGGRLAETIQTLAETTRQRVAMAGKARALSAEARISAVALEVLPIIAGVLLSLEQPGYLTGLISQPAGRKMMAVGAGTLTVGTLIMRWMIRWASEP